MLDTGANKLGLLLPPEMEELIPMGEGAEVDTTLSAPPLPILWPSASHPAHRPHVPQVGNGAGAPLRSFAENMRWDKLVGCGHV